MNDYLEKWMDPIRKPLDRLVRFEIWLYRELFNRLQWPEIVRSRSDFDRQEKMIFQCRVFVLKFVHDLKICGWLIDGQELADLITDQLDAIRAAQVKGRVRDLYPYFRRCFTKYCHANAEKLKEQAMSLGQTIDQVMERIGAPKSMPEIVSEYRQESLHKQRRMLSQRKARAEQEARQGTLL